jgi:hypothetical protein
LRSRATRAFIQSRSYPKPCQRYDDDLIELAQTLPRIKNVLKGTSQGAAVTVWAAMTQVLEGRGALYLEACAVGQESAEEIKLNGAAGISGYASFAFDEERGKKLWAMSCEMVGVKGA